LENPNSRPPEPVPDAVSTATGNPVRPRPLRTPSIGQVGAVLLTVMALAWPLVYDNPYLIALGTMVVLSAIGATSLNLIIRTGHISLAHGAFMGVAAYAGVILETRLHWSFPLALAAGCLSSGLLALILGPIVLRLTGKYFVLVTFLLGEIMRMVFTEWQSLTGGANGIQEIPSSLALFDSPTAFYYFALCAAVICVGIVWRILVSDIGRAIDSVREAERVAECSGVPVIRLKVIVFVISCMLVGVQGVLQAHLVRSIDPTAFNMDISLGMVVMNVLGGMYYLAGPLLGTGFMVALPELLRGYVELQHVIFGIVLIVIMAVLPGGIIGLAAGCRSVLAGYTGRIRK
jgi:branched-chain amino acid transport system permease protein